MASLIHDPGQENKPGSDLRMRSEPISLKEHAASDGLTVVQENSVWL